MGLSISDFTSPIQHPYGMLDGYPHAVEKESTLSCMLKIAVDWGDLYAALPTLSRHTDMVADGLLEYVSDNSYRFTHKAIGLLWIYFGKEERQ